MTSELTWPQAIVLAVVQGLTEFLPISSTGHLVLVRRLLGWADAGGLGFDIVLHAGSLAAVLIYFRRTWTALLGACLRRAGPASERRLAGRLLVATAPVILLGPWLKPYLAKDGLRDLRTVSLSMLATALLFWLTSRRRAPAAEQPLGLRAALRVGLMQVVALLPGASRAGWTTAGGLLAGQTAAASVRFAFLLAVPVLGSATLYHGVELLAAREPLGSPGLLAAGFAVSLAVSVLAIRVCLAYFQRHTLRGFGLYLACAGLLSLALSV